MTNSLTERSRTNRATARAASSMCYKPALWSVSHAIKRLVRRQDQVPAERVADSRDLKAGRQRHGTIKIILSGHCRCFRWKVDARRALGSP